MLHTYMNCYHANDYILYYYVEVCKTMYHILYYLTNEVIISI